MNRLLALALALPAQLLGGCAMSEPAPVTEAAPEPARPAPGGCNAAAAQSQVGQQATQAAGAAILRASGARALRWGPPDSAWTMDYREDRLNVRYDRGMVITAVTCG